MLTITVRLDEKISTASQYENRTAGVLIEESNLELRSPEEVLKKTADLFALARASVSEQLEGKLRASLQPEGNGHQGNGNGHPPVTGQAASPQDSPSGNGHSTDNGNGRKSYARSSDGATPKQKAFLAKLARERKLGPETIRDMAVRMVGKDPRVFTKQDMGKFIEVLLAAGTAA